GAVIIGPMQTEVLFGLTEFGTEIAPTGDVNGDRLDDFFVLTGQDRAKSPVIFGSSAGYPDNINFIPQFTVDHIDGENGFFPPGGKVAQAGGFNGAGFGDLLVDKVVWVGGALPEGSHPAI